MKLYNAQLDTVSPGCVLASTTTASFYFLYFSFPSVRPTILTPKMSNPPKLSPIFLTATLSSPASLYK
jgi:hypothetical protein